MDKTVMHRTASEKSAREHAINELASRQHSLITRAQALALNMTRGAILHRVEQGRWIEMTSGVYRLSGAAETERVRVMAAVLAGGPDAVATGATALGLHGARGFTRTLLPPVVAVARRLPRKPATGLTETFRLAAHHRTVVDGIPTATIARALFDYAGTVGPLTAARAVDAALAARFVTHAQLETVLADLAERGRSGTTIVRAILEERAAEYVSPATVLESNFLELMRVNNIPEPQRQIDPEGVLRAALGGDRRVDFAWPDVRVVVETDGAEYHDSITDRADDERRDRALDKAGWIVLRFGWKDLEHRPTSVVNTVRRALKLAV